MRSGFDRRVVPEETITLLRALQAAAPTHLAGGAALAGLYLSHRLSDDVDLFCHDAEAHRRLVHDLASIGRLCGVEVAIVRDAGSFVRATVRQAGRAFELDLVPCQTSSHRRPPSKAWWLNLWSTCAPRS